MLFSQNIHYKNLFRLALLSFCLAIIVVILGAFTRLADAGLGCPDWPGCYGHLLWPNESHEIVKAEMLFPDAPVELDKTWPEMVHRYFAGALGLFILGLAITAFKKCGSLALENPRSMAPVPFKHTLLLCVLVLVQAAFGMWTVTLKLWPQVVTAHLLGGFATLSLLWLLVQRLGGVRWNLTNNRHLGSLKLLAALTLIVVILQIALGGWVSSNYAALACPDIPQCLGQWIPKADYSTGFNFSQHIGPNYLGGELDNYARTAIHFTHRVGAIIATLFVIAFAIRIWRLNDADARRWALLLCLALTVQIALGVSNVYFSLPLAVAVAHNAVGALLLMIVMTLNFKLITANNNLL